MVFLGVNHGADRGASFLQRVKVNAGGGPYPYTVCHDPYTVLGRDPYTVTRDPRTVAGAVAD